MRIGYRFLEPGEISIHDDRWLTHPWGVNNGLPEARSRKRLVRADGTEQLLHSKLGHVKVQPGDLLLSDTWGGGGWGNPLEGAPELARFDVEAGLVTLAGAKRYGVVLHPEGRVDAGATLVTAFAAETSVAFDRIDTLERLLARQGTLSANAVEAYRPDEDAVAASGRRREELVQRVFGVFEHSAPRRTR
jgi:N-methylhydantoinase B